MAGAEDDWVPGLAAVAERAAPNAAAGPHVVDTELVRIRAGNEDPSLDASYRHLSTCASCRARLVEVAPQVEAAAAPSVRKLHQPKLIRNVIWAAAALSLIGLGYALASRPHVPDQLAVVQRPYAGVMGPHTAEAPHEKTNLELSIAIDAASEAFVLPCGDGGKILSSPQWFARESSGRAVVVLAPRTFLPHSGSTRGLVVWGRHAEVRPVADALSSLALATSPSIGDSALAKLVKEHGARMRWLPLASLE